MKPHELFPETLLVSREGERIFTTSRRLAFHFGKNHQHVLRTIRKLLVDLGEEAGGRSNFGPSSTREAEFGRRNFIPSYYFNEQNKSQPEYELTHDGFMFLAMRFTGSDAARWQIAFIEAFQQQEAELAALRELYISALDQVRPHLRLTVDEAERGLPRRVTAEHLGKSVPVSPTTAARRAASGCCRKGGCRHECRISAPTTARQSPVPD